jgi:dihydrolipoamide dehydrogenase
MSDSFDVIVIGAGPGGYVAAIRAAQLGLRAACVDARASLGGTCLNIGCIPSKALLQSSEKFAEARHRLAEHGIRIEEPTLDLALMMARKDKVVETLTRGVEFLFRKNKVDWLKGAARIAAPGRVAIGDGGREVEAGAIVIATGSESIPLPGLAIDEQRIVSSTGALALDRVPERLAVIGGGYIGLELGSVWSRLGSKVTVIEYLDRILPNMDRELGPALQRLLTRSGIAFKLATRVVGGSVGNNAVTLELEPAAGGERETLAAEIVLVAIGRHPLTEGLGLDDIGVARDAAGRIAVGDDFATNIAGIYAIGDVIRGPMLAHKAMEEGVAVAERLAGQKTLVDYDAIPSVVYTWPEVAAVGRTEEELKAAGVAYRTGKFPFTATPRARTNGDTDGFVKVLADAANDRVLGVHIIGPDAGTMIAEATLAIEFGASSEDIARTCHAHPTLSEALKEAALAVDGRAIHT